ncbi:hypothetical protein V8C42DRAFT_309119 [Trichoderma barbatum]
MKSLILAFYSTFLYHCIARGAFTVPVYFNVLFDKATGEGGYPDSVIYQQIDVLNQHLDPIDLQFHLHSAQRIPVEGNYLHSWENPAVKQDLATQFGVLDPQVLNIFTLGSTPRNESYKSSFPQNYESDPRGDVILIDFGHLPGGQYREYNTGKVLVKAVGHWLGLYSTYEGGCSGNGDYVDDTPAEASPAQGCPRGRDTCPGAGMDPIDNLMDSTTDACRVRFTNGQYSRIRQQLYTYRNIHL